jgi:rRNA small subunit pseudouridine methyltransferase Nep1
MFSGITFILAEAALELVPEELLSHPSVSRHALRLGRRPAHTLLDRSVHHRAMRGLPDSHKRGRPDIVHQSLLEATDTPLYMDGKLEILLHTVNGLVIRLGRNVRPPRSYHRFHGLMVKLLTEGRVTAPDGQVLMEVEGMSLEALIRRSGFRRVVGLSRRGSLSTYADVAALLVQNQPSAFLVGGFPRGGFSPKTQALLTDLLAIDTRPLEAHVVIARQIYEIERAMTGSMKG